MRTEQFPTGSADLRDVRHLDVRHRPVCYDRSTREADNRLDVVLIGNVVPDKIRLIEASNVDHRCLKDIE